MRGDLSPEACALVIVDVQNDFCHPEAPIGRHIEQRLVDGMCSGIAELVQAARTAGVPVIWIRTVHRDATNSAPWLRRLASGDPQVCLEGSWGTRFYKLVPEERDIVVEKHRYSAFHGTELQHVLRALQRTTVIAVGTATNVCVESTVRDACMLDYDAVLVADATCAGSEAEHAAALLNVDGYFGSVTDTADVVRAWLPPEERRPVSGREVESAAEHD